MMTSSAITQTEIEVTGVQEFLGKKIPVIEGGFGESKRCLTDKAVSEIHSMRNTDVRRRITDNIKRFKEDIDFIDLKGVYETHTLEKLGYSKQSITQAENIYLLSERGYAKLIKIMDTDLAWDIHDKLIDEYFAMRKVIKEESSKLDQLSPQLQLLISMELEQKKLNRQIKEVSENLSETKEEIKEIRQVVNLDTTNWRNETRTLIAKIARKQGDLKYIRDFTNESYELLNKRFGVSLETRLKNKKSRMALEGISKSKISNLNNLDVIAEDKKLIEGYVIIVKDMAIKYGI
ncbi:ORF6N domain-containing protein [Paraclostridium bifermentans]|uniref:ORF6N domain-containing protein n=1 Tax=Paraclostridium bifermentans TaxID=1490 RepID=UPI001FF665EF|nr:ORF6N domain-containing protein [Paraclostridium bifermentans]UOW66899.1 ORF6N domain-containing protein [Paraclostridium bifermentans]